MAFGDFTIGSRGAGVTDLQKYLRDLGYNVTVDGAYGPETRAAVLLFQKARGIRADGIAGPETLIALSIARSEGWRAPPLTTAQAGASHATVAANSPLAATGPLAKIPEKWKGLVILLAIAAAVWFFTKPSRAAYAGRRDRDDDGDDDTGDDEP